MINTLHKLLHEDPEIAIGLAWGISVALNAVPPADEHSGKFYTWFYNTAKVIGANFNPAKWLSKGK